MPVLDRKLLRDILRMWAQVLAIALVMAFRHLVRWPVRSLLTTLGTSLAVALLVTALFSFDSIAFMTSVYTALAVIIAFGVVYNSARIQLSERARELAGLRVLGFTRSEVSSVLLIELASIVALAQPLGWILGYLFSWSVVRGFESDLFRIPFVVNRSTFALASLVVLAVATLSALIVRRRIDSLDLVRVLKTRD